jgi:outer membrane protein assembly factor BamD (BamD/ComL family)
MPQKLSLMRCLLLNCLFLLFGHFALCQHKQLERTFNHIQEGDIDKAHKNLIKLQKEYRGTVYESAALYYLYSTKNQPHYNPDSAYYHLKRVESYIPEMRDLEDLELIQFTMNLKKSNILPFEQLLAEGAWENVLKKNTWQAADTFFSRYEHPLHHTEARVRWRDKMEYYYYIQQGNAKSLKRFEKSDKNTYFKREAFLAADSIEFDQTQAIDSEDAWSEFINEHPNSKYIKTAWEKYELRVYTQTKSHGEPDSLNRYLSSFPKGKYHAEALADQERFQFFKVRDRKDIRGLLTFKKKYPTSEYNKQVEQLIESISWELAINGSSISGYIAYLENSTLLEHQEESERRILSMWPESWESSDKSRLESIFTKAKDATLKKKLEYAVGSLTIDEIEAANDLSNLENFLRTNSDSLLLQRAIELRPAILLNEYTKSKNYAIGLSYITDYPDSPQTVAIREELANEFLSRVPKGGKTDVGEFLKHFENTKAYKRILPALEKEYFAGCSKKNSVSSYRDYLKKFPQGAYVKRAQTSILLAWNDSYLENRKKLFNASDFDLTVDFYLTSPIIHRFFEGNRNALRDILAEYYVMEQDTEENKYYYYSGHPEEQYRYYFTHISLLKKMGLSYEVKNNALYVDGISFYDKRSSEFCWECSQHIESEGLGPVVILDDQNNELTGSSYHSIVGTGVPHVFLIKNSKEKYSLFNTKERKLITGWHNEISPVLLDASTFPQNSLEYNLLRLFPIPIGFLTIDSKKDCHACDQRLINFSGQLLIDPTKVSEPCLLPYGLNGRSSTTINNARTFQPLRNYGAPDNRPFSNYFVFSRHKLNDRGYYTESFGIMNSTLDTVLLEADYTSIHDINDFGLVQVEHEKPSKNCKNYKSSASDLIDIYTKKNVTNNPGGTSLRQNHLPFSSTGEILDADLASYWSYLDNSVYMNNYSIEEREEYEGFDEDIENRIVPDSLLGLVGGYLYTFPSPVFYSQNSSYSDCNYKHHESFELLNSNGNVVCRAASDILPHSYLGDKMLFHVNDTGCILVNTEGQLLFDGAKEKYYMQFINSEYLYFWSNEDSAKQVGIYSVSKGKVCDAIYENIKIESDGVYGFRLGSKTKLNIPLRKTRID